MKKNLKLFLLATAFMAGIPLVTNAQFVLSADLRPRAEYRHGYKSPATEKMDAAVFASQRTRLNLTYKNPRMKFGLSLQDVRVWGDVTQQNLSDNSFSVHEAWGEYFISPSLSVKAGRMELIYDDSRLFGNADWLQQGRSHDIGLLKFENTKWKAHAGFAYNQNQEQLSGRIYTVAGNYKNMQLLWLNRKWDKLELSLMFVNNGMQYIEEGEVTNYDTKFTQTYGGTLVYKTKPVTFTANGYNQTGKNQLGKNVSAFMFSANAAISITENFSLVPGIEYLSGTSQLDNPANETNSFTPLYGTGHKFNGHMDYYYAGSHLNSVGLQDIFLKALYKKDSFNTGIDFHMFGAAADVTDPEDFTNVLDNNLGMEIDFYAGYKLSQEVTLNMGYSHYFTTETTTVLKGGSKDETSNWAWISISFKPEFLNTGK